MSVGSKSAQELEIGNGEARVSEVFMMGYNKMDYEFSLDWSEFSMICIWFGWCMICVVLGIARTRFSFRFLRSGFDRFRR